MRLKLLRARIQRVPLFLLGLEKLGFKKATCADDMVMDSKQTRVAQNGAVHGRQYVLHNVQVTLQ